jgi:phospholipid-binding lipoprotein MlaA
MNTPHTHLVLLFCLALLGAGCASKSSSTLPPEPTAGVMGGNVAGDSGDEFDDLFGDDLGPVAPAESDPLEGLNRAIFGLNDFLYTYLLSPIASGYDAVMPEAGQERIRNFFFNLGGPVRIANTALQGKWESSGRELERFLINSTFGMGGLYRVAEPRMKIVPPREDFGQTLGTWGVGEGVFIVWPLLGPSTLRDTAGRFGDYWLDPVNYIEDWEWETGLRVTDFVNSSPGLIRNFNDLKAAAVDPYAAFRDAYLKTRRKAVEE